MRNKLTTSGILYQNNINSLIKRHYENEENYNFLEDLHTSLLEKILKYKSRFSEKQLEKFSKEINQKKHEKYEKVMLKFKIEKMLKTMRVIDIAKELNIPYMQVYEIMKKLEK